MKDDIRNALEVLRNGGTILYPTDTIWGIGCDATNPEAVEKIYKIKKRPESKSMLVLLYNENLLGRYISEVPEIARELIDVADKPLTIIYQGARNLAANLISEDGSIGIRIPNDEFCSQLLFRFRKPVVSTSANISGDPSPAGFNEISSEIRNSVDYVVNWRQEENMPARPSSIIQLGPQGQIRIIRK